MFKKCKYIILLFLALLNIKANAFFIFEKTISMINNETGICIIHANGGGCFIGGRTDQSIYLLRLNNNGDTLFTKIYSAPYSSANAMCQTYDGKYAICGSTYNGSKYFVDLVKLDTLGEIEWSNKYGQVGSTTSDMGVALIQTPDSGFFIAGTTNSFGGNRGAYLIKTNSSGALLWSKKYNSGDALLDVYAACLAPGGGCYLLATSILISTGYSHILLIRTNSVGDTLWTKQFEGPYYDYARSVVSTNDGGAIVGGHCKFSIGLDYDAFLFKVDSAGNQVWGKTYSTSENEILSSVKKVSTGELVFTGTYNNVSTSDDDYLIVKTDSAGNFIWGQYSGDANPQSGIDVTDAFDAGYLVTGNSYSKLSIFKTDSSGDACIYDPIYPVVSPFLFLYSNIAIAVNNAPSTTVNQILFNESAGGTINVPCFNQIPCVNYIVNATASQTSTCHSTIQLGAVASTPSSTYQWSPAVNLDNPDIANPLVSYSFNQDFIVTSTDTITGCFATDTVSGISAMNDFTETYKTCGSFVYDFYLPGGADSYLWSSYTDSTGTSHTLNDTNQLITSVGAPCVYYGSADFSGCIVNATFILLDTCSTTGVGNLSSNNIEIFPNPANDYLVINTRGIVNYKIYIADILGKIVFESQHAESMMLLSAKEFSRGMHIVTIDDGRKIIHKKIQIIN